MEKHNLQRTATESFLVQTVMVSKIYDQIKTEMESVTIHIHGMKIITEMIKFDCGNFQRMHGDISTHFSNNSIVQKPCVVWTSWSIFSIHLHGTLMDVYVSDRKLAPFHRMSLIRSLQIPLTNENPSSTIKTVTELCETLLTLNSPISCNFQLLDYVVREIQNITPTTPPYKQNNSIPTNVTPSSRDRPYLV